MSEVVPKQLYDEAISRAEKKERRIGVLETQLDREKKYRLLLSVRSRIERLEAIFKARDLLDGKKCNRVDTWLTIFNLSRHRMVNDLEAKILKSGLTIEEFCEAVGIIYGDFSDRAAHGVPLPKEIKDRDITEVVQLLEVDDDEPIEKTLNILVKKLTLVNKTLTESSSSSDSHIYFVKSNAEDDKNSVKTEDSVGQATEDK